MSNVCLTDYIDTTYKPTRAELNKVSGGLSSRRNQEGA